MNHISELTRHPDFYSKPFLVLGTGPSLDNFNWDDHKDKNIIAIYSAIEVCESAFIHFAQDEIYYKQLLYGGDQVGKLVGKHIATRAFNSKFEPKTLKELKVTTKTLYFEYNCDVKNYPNPDHEIPFDGVFHGGDGKRYFPFHELWPCANTSKAVMAFLGMAGIKKCYICGIDGGKGTSVKMTDGYKKEHTDFDFTPEYNDFINTANKYGIELTRV